MPPEKIPVHENLICSQSPFFRDAINGPWRESETRIVTLPTHEPDTFRLYTTWLYRCPLASHLKVDQNGIAPAEEGDFFAKAYILGDYLQDIDFQDRVMDLMLQRAAPRFAHRYSWSPSFAGLIYENTPESSPARRFVADLYAWDARPGWIESHKDGANGGVDFLFDLSMALYMRTNYISRGNPLAHPKCTYHKHVSADLPCYKRKSDILPNSSDTPSGQRQAGQAVDYGFH